MLTIEALRWRGAREFKTEGTGRYSRSGNGKFKEERVGVEYVTTVGAGTMRISDWYLAAEEAVAREGKTELLATIEEYCRHHCAWLHTEEAIRQYALEVLCNEAYKHWTDLYGAPVALEEYF